MRFAAPFVVLIAGSPLFAQTPAPDFTRDIRSILVSKCFQCHGPDDKVRKAGLRLDTREGAIRKLDDGKTAIVPGDIRKSELVQRVTSNDSMHVMPPAKTGKRLTADEINVLSRWIAAGAPYPQHWAYVKPARTSVPETKDKNWPITPIDRFILARLEKEGLKPNGLADAYTIIRRLSIDLTGLPPTIAEAGAFAKEYAAKPQAAYEALVDNLLAKKSYGERWASLWLDLARYADSQGFANDPDRTIWRYRDWVIQALNDNLPYDQFTIQQLAGDMLPSPTTSQLIATGFHRNTLTNTEGGTNPEEFRSAAVVDRVNTTFQVWLGTTIACSQCHNHKYDPFSQKEFFQIYAILNNCEDANGGNDVPTITVATAGQEEQYDKLSKQLAEVKKESDEEIRKVDVKQAEWEKSYRFEGPLFSDRSASLVLAAIRSHSWLRTAKALSALPKDVADIMRKQPKDRKAPETQKLQAHHRGLHNSWKALDKEMKFLEPLVKNVSTTAPILREGKARETRIQLRGNFLDIGDKVEAGLPAALPRAEDGTINRLTFARWIVSEDNPLTARVAVNRIWEELFGTGIVETSEDFGTQGELPSHPELLDWLATEYIRLRWDTKSLIKLIVSSAAYRQSSLVNDEVAKRDSFNRLMARGPRVRLTAEAVRDQALFASGLLSSKMYGPPVQPPKPNFGLNAAFGGSTDWQPSVGEDKYRRALYTKVRRNAPYPSLTTFDAPERTYCNVRRIRTNTPLQALVTLNDPVYVEAAQALARHVMKEDGDTATRMRYAFRLVLTRSPTESEVKRLVELFEKAREKYLKDDNAATAMATKPLGALPMGVKAVDAAAWTVVANVLLNLDETLAKR
jgi:Protein of unknown function (DUF1553)/Protein of unknown function (DUF1549)/Planctomycete cytochrome C